MNKFKEKWYQFKDKAQQKANEAWDWIVNNKETIIAVSPVIFAGVKWLSRNLGRHVRYHKEQMLKDRYIYDRSTGHYWYLKRKPSTKEWIEINTRKKNGEDYSTILSSFRNLI